MRLLLKEWVHDMSFRRALRVVAAIGFAMLLNSCSAGMDDTFARYKGANIQQVITRIGFPANHNTMLGSEVYNWQSTNGDQQCQIQFSTDATGTIKTGHWVGSILGCNAYFTQLGE